MSTAKGGFSVLGSDIRAMYVQNYSCSLAFMNAFAGSYSGMVEKIDLYADKWATHIPSDIGLLSLYTEGISKSCNETDSLS